MNIDKKALLKAIGITAGLVAICTLVGWAMSGSRLMAWVALALLFALIVYTFYQMIKEDKQ